MAVSSYSFQQPQNTYTIEDFISCQSDEDVCFNNLSFQHLETYEDISTDIKYPVYNVLGDYLEEIRQDYCVPVVMSDKEFIRYRYRPKLLSFDVYGATEIFFIVLEINDMYSVKQFVKKHLILPTKANMKEIMNKLVSANKTALDSYNTTELNPYYASM